MNRKYKFEPICLRVLEDSSEATIPLDIYCPDLGIHEASLDKLVSTGLCYYLPSPDDGEKFFVCFDGFSLERAVGVLLGSPDLPIEKLKAFEILLQETEDFGFAFCKSESFGV